MAEATKLPVKTEKPALPAEREWMSFDSLRREIDRLFEDFRPFGWRLPARRPMGRLDLAKGSSDWSVSPAFDLFENEQAFEITAELPGIDEKNIDIKLSNHLLTIRGEKSDAREEGDRDYYLSERRFGSFQRTFQIPEGVDADKIEASFSKGVLTVQLPKSSEARHAEKRIAIKAA